MITYFYFYEKTILYQHLLRHAMGHACHQQRMGERDAERVKLS